jgi:hypothetical protein
MSDERFERKLVEALEAAEKQPRLPEGWEQRAAERLAAVRTRDPGPRVRWQTVAIAALVVAALGAVPYSAHTARAPALGAMAAQQAAEAAEKSDPQPSAEPISRKTHEEGYLDAARKDLAAYREHAIEFVRSHYPKDPEMLMAAGLLTDDAQEGLALLQRAAERGNSPAAWSAYVEQLMDAGPVYDRPGRWGVDPEDTKGLAEMARTMQERKLPDRISPEQAAPVLSGLARWEQADPQNATPVAHEVFYLYGLHDDAKALERWRYAASLPTVLSRHDEMGRAVARLLSRMGMPAMQAIQSSYTAVRISTHRSVRESARVAVYEGRVAQMQGRAADAIAWWNSTIAIGRHMQESPTCLVDYVVGVAVEGIGATPAWKWYSGREVGMEDGPLFEGRYLLGPQHEFYVSQVGEAADREVRDHLVLAKARTMAQHRLLERPPVVSPAIAWVRPLSGAMVCAMALVMLLAAFLAIGVWRRRQADGATALSTRGKAFIVLLTLLAAFGGAAVAAARAGLLSREDGLRLLFLGGPVASFLLALGLPLVAAVRSRRPGARLVTAWRGNLRATLLVSVAACAVVVLGLAATVKVAQRRSIAEWYRGSPTEMQRLTQLLGPAWTNPKIPPDSWRAEFPPEPKK